MIETWFRRADVPKEIDHFLNENILWTYIYKNESEILEVENQIETKEEVESQTKQRQRRIKDKRVEIKQSQRKKRS